MKKNKKGWMKSRCALGHLFGNGTEVYFKDKCPQCGGEIVGFTRKEFVTMDITKMKGWVGSKGTA